MDAFFEFGLEGSIDLDFNVPDGNTALVGGVGEEVFLFAAADEDSSFSLAAQESEESSTFVVSTAEGDTTLTTGLAGPGFGIGVAFSENEDFGGYW